MAEPISIKIAFKPALDNLGKQFSDFKADSPLRQEIAKILYKIESYSKQLTPVKTGRLRSSEATSLSLNEIGGRVSTNVDYAIYVHEGTKYMKARPFLEAAANLIEPSIAGILSARLEREFTDTFKSL